MDSSLHVDEEIEKIYNRQFDTVYRVCFSFMKNAEDAEDMMHCSESTVRNQLLRGRKLLKKNRVCHAKSGIVLAAVLVG